MLVVGRRSALVNWGGESVRKHPDVISDLGRAFCPAMPRQLRPELPRHDQPPKRFLEAKWEASQGTCPLGYEMLYVVALQSIIYSSVYKCSPVRYMVLGVLVPKYGIYCEYIRYQHTYS